MNELNENAGVVKISDEVIATIANVALSEIDGVSMELPKNDAKTLLGKKVSAKGVKITSNDKNVSLEVDVTINYGVKITEVAWNVQENIKKSIESMTGLNVEKVNVHVVNIVLPKKSEDILPDKVDESDFNSEE